MQLRLIENKNEEKISPEFLPSNDKLWFDLVNEAQRLGYKNIYISSDIKQDFNSTKINVKKFSNVKEIVKSIFMEQG